MLGKRVSLLWTPTYQRLNSPPTAHPWIGKKPLCPSALLLYAPPPSSVRDASTWPPPFYVGQLCSHRNPTHWIPTVLSRGPSRSTSMTDCHWPSTILPSQ